MGSWQTSTVGSGISITGSVENANPFPGQPPGTNYLDMEIIRTTTSTRQAILYRSYTDFGGLQLTQDHTIETIFRINDVSGLTGTTQYFMWADSPADLSSNSNYNPVGTETTWAVWAYGSSSVYGDRELLIEGADRFETGIFLEDDTVYSIKIEIDAMLNQFTATVTDLTNSVSFAATTGFGRNRTEVSGQLGLGFRGGGPIDYDVASIAIVPEPSSILLGLLAFLLLYGPGRRPSRRLV